MKRLVIDTFLLKLDNSLRWTGIPARVADAMSDDPLVNRKHRPLRWLPIWPIVYSCALFIVFFVWPSSFMGFLGLVFPPSVAISFVFALALVVATMVPVIYSNGPLGQPALEDDEREAALRKDSFLFCFGLLAGLNCLGQPLLIVVAVSQHWQIAQCVSVAGSVFMLNVSLLGCLPTLYASWTLTQLPKE